jgi:alpha-ketoglutarate-dependent taurine dioxygenase
MRKTGTGEAGRSPFAAVTRRAITDAQASWVRVEPWRAGASGPVVLSPAITGVDLIPWVENNRQLIEGHLLKSGALLFRGFEAEGVAGFEQFIRTVSGELLDYCERSSPRHQVHGHVYTSTDYPAHQFIYPHNENSYQHVWPMKIFFFCQTPAARGGETPTADTREVLGLLSPATVARFIERGCMYVRNFDDQLGLPWQTVFQTDDRSAAEQYCRAAGIAFEWKEGGGLRTRAVRPAVATHPRTGERVWFNHVAFFNVSTLDPSIREGLLATMKEADLPANTYYGDGSPIEPEVLDEIRDAYRRATVSFDWQRGDILLLDNMLTAHSRTPYTGERSILVGMSEPYGYEAASAQL